MTPHDRLTDPLRETAQQYALGSLSEPERLEFERHLQEGCAVCSAEVRADEALAAELALSTTPRAARPEVKARLFERLRSERRGNDVPPAVQTWKQWKAEGPIDRFLPRDDGAFEATGSAGVFVRRLF